MTRTIPTHAQILAANERGCFATSVPIRPAAAAPEPQRADPPAYPASAVLDTRGAPTSDEVVGRVAEVQGGWSGGAERHRRTGSEVETPYFLPGMEAAGANVRRDRGDDDD